MLCAGNSRLDFDQISNSSDRTNALLFSQKTDIISILMLAGNFKFCFFLVFVSVFTEVKSFIITGLELFISFPSFTNFYPFLPFNMFASKPLWSIFTQFLNFFSCSVIMIVSIVTINVNGLANPTKQQSLFSKFLESKHDIICVQETKCPPELVRQWSDEWPGLSYWNAGTIHSKGVSIFLKPSFAGKVLDSDTDFNKRVLTLTIEINNFKFKLTTIYGPNTEFREKNETFFDCLEI